MPQCLSVGVAKAHEPILHEDEVVGLRVTGGELGKRKVKEEGNVLCEGAEGRQSI